jgi:signal transduction histidine kinase
VHYPVAFLEPMTADALSGLGLDLIAEPHLAAALALALERNATAATVPFDLSDGARGYLLFRPVCASHQESCSGEAAEAKPRLVAGLAVRANALIDCDPDIPSDFTCALYYDQADGGEKRPLLELQSAYRATALERLLFPRVERDRRIDSVSQPLMLAVSEQLGFRSFDLSLAAAVVAVSLMGLALILAAVRSQVRSDRERGRAQQALTEERRGLEQRVQERTQALFQLNAELSQENEARRTAERRLALNERQARGLARRVLDIQEQERRALARELHDDIGQSLTAIRTHARLIREQALDPNSATARSAEAIGAVAANLYDRAHRLMRRLRPRALDDAGLAAAIESCVAAAEIEPLGIRVHLRLERDLDGLDEAVNITLYRVLQEALTNVARHSGAHNVYIRLTRTDPVDLGQGGQAGAEITLEVQDDGRGLAEAAAGTGFGLMGLRERVDSLGGIFELDTAPGGGLTLRVRVPLTSGG